MCLTLSTFPDCCGIHIINGFRHRGPTEYGVVPKPDEYAKYLKEKANPSSVGLHLVALNHYQVKEYGKLLEKAGYKVLVDSFYHPGHGHCITLYGQVQHGEGEKPDTVPVKTKTSMFGKAVREGVGLAW